jgi:hypothetical protein
MDQTHRRQHPWSIRDQEPHPVRPAISNQARHPDSTVSDGRDDSPSDQLAIDSSTEQAAPPPTGRGPHPSDTSLKNNAVFGAAGRIGPRKADQAATATVVFLALEIVDSNIISPNADKTHKRPFEFIFDVFAESDNETTINHQKRLRCSDVVINDITDDDNVDDGSTR